MKKDFIEAYVFYKRKYPKNVVLFHIGDSYYAFDDDARVVARVCNLLVCRDSDINHCLCKIHHFKLQEVLNNLRNIESLPVTSVEYRNEFGEFDIPKVKQILQDMEDDY